MKEYAYSVIGGIQTNMKKILAYPFFILLALASALSYKLFIFPNEFAPAGFNGLATMIQHLLGINVGYLSLLVNIPLIIAVFILVDKRFAINTLVYILSFAGSLILLDYVDMEFLIYKTEQGTSTILGPLVAGVINGAILGIAFLANCSSGGTDLVAAIIHKFKPSYDFIWVTFVLNAFVAVISFFVYGYKFEPVILCILYCYAQSVVSDKMLKGNKEAARFEVVTDYPEEIAKEVIEKLGHSATLINAEGCYTHNQKNILICVVNKDQIVPFKQILSNYPGTFACVSIVSYTIGAFINKHASDSPVSN